MPKSLGVLGHGDCSFLRPSWAANRIVDRPAWRRGSGCDSMNDSYDEENVLAEYVAANFAHLMNEFEKKVYRLSIQREKAANGSAHRLPRWIAEAGHEAAVASEAGYHSVKRQISQRIVNDVTAGEIIVSRCPNCSRIVRTPLAKQCLWCGHDWHEAEAC
jgi:hypothetical protein